MGNIHCYQTRWCPTRTRQQDHRSIREPRLQTRRHETLHARPSPPRGTLPDLKSKKFFNGLCEYMNSGPICAMVWEGKDAVRQGRAMLGATNPLESAPGSIRGDFCIDLGRNVCHGSDAVSAAEHEIALWFKPEELMTYTAASSAWIYE